MVDSNTIQKGWLILIHKGWLIDDSNNNIIQNGVVDSNTQGMVDSNIIHKGWLILIHKGWLILI